MLCPPNPLRTGNILTCFQRADTLLAMLWFNRINVMITGWDQHNQCLMHPVTSYETLCLHHMALYTELISKPSGQERSNLITQDIWQHTPLASWRITSHKAWSRFASEINMFQETRWRKQSCHLLVTWGHVRGGENDQYNVSFLNVSYPFLTHLTTTRKHVLAGYKSLRSYKKSILVGFSNALLTAQYFMTLEQPILTYRKPVGG